MQKLTALDLLEAGLLIVPHPTHQVVEAEPAQLDKEDQVEVQEELVGLEKM
jgi:hypothetical protein